MSKHLSRTVVENTLNQLVEAWHDEEAASADLDRFEETFPAPKPPPEFENVRAFLDFHDRRQTYDDEVQKREKNIASAERRYVDAAIKLRGVLPGNVPLHYEYSGNRQQLYGHQYRIVSMAGGDVIVSSTEALVSPTDQNQ